MSDNITNLLHLHQQNTNNNNNSNNNNNTNQQQLIQTQHSVNDCKQLLVNLFQRTDIPSKSLDLAFETFEQNFRMISIFLKYLFVLKTIKCFIHIEKQNDKQQIINIMLDYYFTYGISNNKCTSDLNTINALNDSSNGTTKTIIDLISRIPDEFTNVILS
jgi:hypothetical protein